MAAVKSTLLFLLALVGVSVAIRAICPPNSTYVICSTNPCELESCPAYPLANCRINNCGGCSAQFFVEGVQVNCEVCRDGSKLSTCDTNLCERTQLSAGLLCVPDFCSCGCGVKFVKLCPDGSQPDECLMDPCATTICPVGASCVSDRCSYGNCAASCVSDAPVNG